MRPRSVCRAVLLVLVAVLAAPACNASDPEREPEPVRTVHTPAGDVTVPVEVRTVVTTHNIATQPLIDLGLPPAGIGDMTQAASYPDYWSQIDELPKVTSGQEIDLERIAQLDPDVVFAINLDTDADLQALRAIAPVVVIGISGAERSDWQGRAKLIADVVNRPEVETDLANRFATRAQQIKARHADVLADQRFTVLDSFDRNTVVPYSPTSMAGKILTAAGARFAPSATSELVTGVDAKAAGDQDVSIELLPDLLDGSAVLHGSQASDDKPSPTQQAMLASPLFRRSAPARGNRVFGLGKTLIAGYGDAFQTLEHFDAALTQLG